MSNGEGLSDEAIFGPPPSPDVDDLVVDDEGEDIDTPDPWERALPYARYGLRVLPVNSETKRPLPGYEWKAQATSKVNEVIEDFMFAAEVWGADCVSVAWALGLDGCMALDLDVAVEPDWWAEVEGVAVVNQTRRGRHLIFRQPDLEHPCGNGVSRFPPSASGKWGEVRGAGGYIVVAGPDRPGLDPEALGNVVPFPRPEWLTIATGIGQAATPGEVEQFLADHVDADNDGRKLRGLRSTVEGQGRGSSIHEHTLAMACMAAREALAGRYSAADGLSVVRDWWEASWAQRATSSSHSERTQPTRGEWEGIIAWAVAAAGAEPERIKQMKTDDGADPTRLSAAFFDQTPELAHLAAFADSLVISREALLVDVLVNVTMHIPPAVYIPGPPRSGAPNLIAINAGRPGAGKGSAFDAADEVFPPLSGTKTEPLGTAEGFVKAFHKPNPDVEDAKTNRRPLVRDTRPVRVRADEIGALVQQAGRQSASGEGLAAQLKQMASGERLGFGYATDEKRLRCDPLSYRAGLVCGVAPAKGQALFDDRGGGLPERMIFAKALPANPPTDPNDIPPSPGPLPWRPVWGDSARTYNNKVPLSASVQRSATVEFLARRSEHYVENDLDVHRSLNRIKVAVALASLHGQAEVDQRFYDMAETVMTMSDAVRSWLLDEIGVTAQATNRNQGRKLAEREGMAEKARAEANDAHQLEKITKYAHKLYELVSSGEIDTVNKASKRMRTLDRESIERSLEHAIEMGWLIEVEEETTAGGSPARRLHVGKQRP